MARKSGNGSYASKRNRKTNKKVNGAGAKRTSDVAAETDVDEEISKGNGADVRALEERPEKSGKHKVEFESMLTRDEAAAYFEAIVSGLRKGSIHFHRSDHSLTLSPGQHVGVEVKATQKGGREKLVFELVWRTDRGSELTILAGEFAEEHAAEPA
jgi:amphi-Trp domain-containing protein